MLDVLLQHRRKVAGSGDQDVVEAFAAEGADPAFGDGIRAGCSNWGAQDTDVGAGEHGVEGGGELGIAVAGELIGLGHAVAVSSEAATGG